MHAQPLVHSGKVVDEFFKLSSNVVTANTFQASWIGSTDGTAKIPYSEIPSRSSLQRSKSITLSVIPYIGISVREENFPLVYI